MHCLEVIVKRNAEAAGREAAHAANDGDTEALFRLLAPDYSETSNDPNVQAAFLQGYARGRQEG